MKTTSGRDLHVLRRLAAQEYVTPGCLAQSLAKRVGALAEAVSLRGFVTAQRAEMSLIQEDLEVLAFWLAVTPALAK